MATLLADPANPPDAGQAPAPAPAVAPQPDSPTPAPDVRACAKCDSTLGPGQDWCLQCGAGAPGSLGTETPSWRTGGAIAALAAVLVLGAAAAGYAALNRDKGPAHVVIVAQSTAAPAATPTPGAAATPTPGAAVTPGGAASGLGTGIPGVRTPGKVAAPAIPKLNLHLKLGLPKTLIKAPKIPLVAITPKPAATAPASTTPTNTTSAGSQTAGGSEGAVAQPEAILLDTDAASTYNPNAYPASNFGDPSLVNDGDTSTAWTAQLEPALAPKVEAGVALDLKSLRRVSALVLVTDTPGMTIQVFATAATTLPAAISDPAWVKLSSGMVESGRHLRIPLRESSRSFRFVMLWISRAPASSVGTAQAPGHVSVNELEVFPAG